MVLNQLLLQVEPVILKVPRDKLALSLVQLVYGNAGTCTCIYMCLHVHIYDRCDIVCMALGL